MTFNKKVRKSLRQALFFLTILLYVAAILLNALSEYYFWNEFGVRYNFIAVDYLIYTNEVIGNIFESYPVISLFTILGLTSFLISFFIFRKTKNYLELLPDLLQKVKLINVYLAMLVFSVIFLPGATNSIKSENVYANELQADGAYNFYKAFVNSNLSYVDFYPKINSAVAFQIIKQQLPGLQNDYTRNIKTGDSELHKNIVLISVESLSADFMQHFGNTKSLTPFLDSLADKSLFFTNLYAAGNRTVRGLEALTLCMPPSPGESIIKQKNNKNVFTIATILKKKSYDATFLYGGYSYFDNMRDFFEGNGYKIVDRNNMKPDEISFANIWGACDEDMAKKCIQTINGQVRNKRPFFCHWMTVSNHRPFTYPDKKIDISGHAKLRDGGVKYTDFSIGRFFQLAEKELWFQNTVFVIVADHCASSAGKVELPLDKYHIPALIFAPGLVKPRQVNTLMSQIDLMPTLFGLLHFSYSTSFFGQNIFDTSYHPRAFLATYQSLGYLKDSTLTVLSPVKQVKQYALIQDHLNTEESLLPLNFKEVPLKHTNEKMYDEAISFYQTAAKLVQGQSK